MDLKEEFDVRKNRGAMLLLFAMHFFIVLLVVLHHLNYFRVITLNSPLFDTKDEIPMLLLDLVIPLMFLRLYSEEGDNYVFDGNTFYFDQKRIYYLFKKEPYQKIDLINIEKIEKYHNYSLGVVLLKVYTHDSIYYISDGNITGALVHQLTEERDREKLFEDIEIKDSTLLAGFYRFKGGRTEEIRGYRY